MYGLSSIVGRLLNYLLVPIYTRVFVDTAEYGIVTEMYAYAGFFIVVYTYGMETAFFRFQKDTNKLTVLSTSFLSVFFSSLLFSALLLFSSSGLAALLTMNGASASFLGPQAYRKYIDWFALILFFDAVAAVPFARLRAENRPFVFAGIKLLNILINVGLNIYFIVIAPKLVSAHAMQPNLWMPASPHVDYVFISNLIASGFTLILLVPGMLRQPWAFDTHLWKKMIRYALPLVIVGLAGAVNEMLDRILLKYLLPYTYEENMAALGIYGACYKLSILMTLFTQAYRYAAEPFYFAQYGQKNDRATYANVMKYFIVAGCLIFLGVMLFIDVVKHFIGKEYHGGLHVVPILLMANLALGVYYNLSIWYKLNDKTAMGAAIAVGGAVITIVLNWLLIPRMGYAGAAWATLCCYALMTIASYLVGQRVYPVPYDIPRILGYIALALVIYGGHVLVRSTLDGGENRFWEYVSAVAFLVFFVVIIWWMEKKPARFNTTS